MNITQDKNQTLRQYVTDMRALDQYLLEMVELQSKDEHVQKNSEANRIIGKIVATTKLHISNLDAEVKRLEAEPRSAVKGAITSLAGTAMGLINKVRSHEVSKMLRDDYTVLSLSAISYTMLHTTGLALSDSLIANLALTHLKNITPLVIEVSQIIPSVVNAELAEEGDSVNSTASVTAINNTQQAWRQHYAS